MTVTRCARGAPCTVSEITGFFVTEEEEEEEELGILVVGFSISVFMLNIVCL